MTETPETPTWYRPIWICLVGGQTLPNILPMLAERPQKVHFLHTSESEEQAVRCKKFVKTYLRVDCTLHQVDPFDMRDVARTVEKIKEMENPERLLLNWTGGTKPMSMAAWNAIPPSVIRLYYEPRHGVLVNDSGWEPIVLKQHVTVAGHFLLNAGVAMEDVEVGVRPAEGCETTRQLVALFQKDPKILDVFVEIRTDKSKILTPGLNLAARLLPHAGAIAVLRAAMNADGLLLQMSKGDGLPLNMNGVCFLRGGFWFEAYVERCIRSGLQTLSFFDRADLHANIQFSWPGKINESAKNEIDAAFVYQSRLFLISCTTAKDFNEVEKRLMQIRMQSERLGGRYGSALLASILNNSQIKRLKTRHGEAVLLLHWTEWQKPAELLRRWIDSAPTL